jgi:hypothetical protein
MFAQFDSIVLPPLHDHKKLFLPLPQPQPQQQPQQPQAQPPQPGVPTNVNSPVMSPNAANNNAVNINRSIGQPVNVHYIHHHHYHHDPVAQDVNHDAPLQQPMSNNHLQYANELLVHPSPILPPLKPHQHQHPHLDMYTPLPSTTPVRSISSTSPRSNPLSSSSNSPISLSHQSKIQECKVNKPRKKKQCPQCNLFFSNLSTHRSTHLSPQNRPFQCSVCNRGFSRSNDLCRHEKRHWKETGSDEGAYKCPFNTVLLPKEKKIRLPSNIQPCHSTGVFSRCDTYKNHLKALHFEYPIGTKKKMRNGVPGNCKLCGKLFKTVDDWLTNHVETGECHF